MKNYKAELRVITNYIPLDLGMMVQQQLSSDERESFQLTVIATYQRALNYLMEWRPKFDMKIFKWVLLNNSFRIFEKFGAINSNFD